ncbi:MAG: hypothetical protein M1820_003415 [Bogoriella megaspora]|nr:MAG: hypothetical protein M1820_003415 [Bogoriella megaspora]
MIRRGRSEGWLTLPTSALPAWSTLNNIEYDGVKVKHLPGFEDRGSALVAQRSLVGGEEQPLITVPRDMVLSLELVNEHAKSDEDLRNVLACLGEFGRVGRFEYLSREEQIIVMLDHFRSNSLVKPSNKSKKLYIKFLPEELLPTFWTDSERKLLIGTTLQPALEAKLKSLFREFDLIRSSTDQISWCKDIWWDEIDGLLDLDDWKQCDAMYRSRALEFPGIGDAMVPGIDMANHASGDDTAALYETDGGGNAVLILLDRKRINVGDEVTITYGDAKGACEMLFSYGFIEDSMTSAREMFLDLEIPDDDPLKRAKNIVSTFAPGFRLYDNDVSTSWESDYIWLICVNEEDGLEFKVVQSIHGEQELRVSWKDEELADISGLRSRLESESMWDVFHLRALSIIKARVEYQLSLLSETDDAAHLSACGEETYIRAKSRDAALKLRTLERILLEKALGDFEKQSGRLLQSEVIQRYLQLGTVEEMENTRLDHSSEEDFA